MDPRSLTRRVLSSLFLALFALFTLVAAPAAAQDFSIVVLPDTQNYSTSYPNIFSAQTQWIANNKDALNIVFLKIDSTTC